MVGARDLSSPELRATLNSFSTGDVSGVKDVGGVTATVWGCHSLPRSGAAWEGPIKAKNRVGIFIVAIIVSGGILEAWLPCFYAYMSVSMPTGLQ
jgi:hypothetical protein